MVAAEWFRKVAGESKMMGQESSSFQGVKKHSLRAPVIEIGGQAPDIANLARYLNNRRSTKIWGEALDLLIWEGSQIPNLWFMLRGHDSDIENPIPSFYLFGNSWIAFQYTNQRITKHRPCFPIIPIRKYPYTAWEKQWWKRVPWHQRPNALGSHVKKSLTEHLLKKRNLWYLM